MLLDVVRVKANPDFSLWLEFENGDCRRFEMAPYMDQQPWTRLKTNHGFLGAFVENGTVAWPGNIDIDPETLYELSTSQLKGPGSNFFEPGRMGIPEFRGQYT